MTARTVRTRSGTSTTWYDNIRSNDACRSDDLAAKIIAATIAAAGTVNDLRFWKTERGFHGAFYYALWGVLLKLEVLNGHRILEMEYQKSVRHRTSQRPDIILHIPAEFHDLDVTMGNFAVWALKHRASAARANDDFNNLDDMFMTLKYPLGFFINVEAKQHHLDRYDGRFRNRLHAFALQRKGQERLIRHGLYSRGQIIERTYLADGCGQVLRLR